MSSIDDKQLYQARHTVQYVALAFGTVAAIYYPVIIPVLYRYKQYMNALETAHRAFCGNIYTFFLISMFMTVFNTTIETGLWLN